MPDPQKASGVWTQMPFLRGREGAARLVELRAIVQDAKLKAQARRERVLRHEWARRELCQIMGYSRAEQWTGYVPPSHLAHGPIDIDPEARKASKRIVEGEPRRNDAPVRGELISLLRRVEEYEAGRDGRATDQNHQA